MATEYYCDRCRQRIGRNSLNTLKLQVDGSVGLPGIWRAKDLCGQCLQALDEWLKPLAR